MEGQVGVRVATLNLWGPGKAWNERRPVLAQGLRGMQPDLVAFQEAIVDDGRDRAEEVLGEGYHVVHPWYTRAWGWSATATTARPSRAAGPWGKCGRWTCI